LEEVLAITTLAVGVVLVGLRGVLHGEVGRSRTELSHGVCVIVDDGVVVGVVVVVERFFLFFGEGVENILVGVSGNSFLVVVVVEAVVVRSEARHLLLLLV